MRRKPVIFGSDVKLSVTVSNLGGGVTLKDCDFILEFRAGRETYTISVTAGEEIPGTIEFVEDDDNTVIVALQTDNLDRGELFLLTTVFVPDTLFGEGVRKVQEESDLGFPIV